MRRYGRRIVLIILAAAGIFGRKMYTDKMNDNTTPSTIDNLINTTNTGNNTTGEVTIDVDANAGSLVYEGGGEYASYSADTVNAARSANKRIILVFERQGDPTDEALHDDIVKREARIPKNTIIFFVNKDSEALTSSTYGVDYANTVVYINKNGEEIRRIGNGVISLAQIVNGIDGLVTK